MIETMTYCNTTVVLSDLSTGYVSHKKSICVAQGLNASLSTGSLTCLLGPNGAGKSTLLKTMCGFLPPLHGHILLKGTDICAYRPSELARAIGVVLTDRLPVANMTVGELVQLGRSPYTGFLGRLDDNDIAIVNNALDMVGMSHMQSRLVHTLSDGERQKAMIAKAIAQQTPLILLDEPTAFLDFPSKVEIMRLLAMLAHTQGKTVFLSTHDIDLALQIADSIWLLDKQLGLTVGSPEDLALDGALSAYFSSKGISFDSMTGLFQVNHPADKTEVRLEMGTSIRHRMMQKALQRVGYHLSDNPNHPINITVSDSAFGINGSQYAKISDLLSELEHFS